MSTRAKYKVRVCKGISESFDFCFYKHHDGYPEGAASHFKHALDLKFTQIHGLNMGKRLAMIDGFEFIRDHDSPSDTEYRYDICETSDSIYLTAYMGGDTTWTPFFDGTLQEFILRYMGG